ncbi:MAG: tryptophan-rich sensory protein [Candidatus Heimdallarchaeota archaeon]|nr:MAG: tryptophan-rich sensory protein [Candidatus Heimdallarchaeota archaeon]
MVNITNKELLIVGNIIGLALTLFVNFLANALPLNGITTGELSDSYPNLFVPSGYVFAIWGAIYILLFIFVVFQVLPKQRNAEFHKQISGLFIISSLANSLWIFLWHYEQVLFSLVTMLVLLASLILIYWRLEIGLNPVPLNLKLAVHTPFSVYLGWITVATVANVTAFLVSINWDGLGISETIWTLIVLTVATIITIVIILQRKDIAYTLVPIWAFIGIFIKQIENVMEVSLFAAICALILIVLLAVRLAYEKYKTQISK